MNLATEFAVKYGLINENGAATYEIVAAVTGSKIRLLSFAISTSGAGSILFESGTTDLSGIIAINATTIPVVLPFNQLGWLETTSGAALNLTTTGAVDFDGCFSYIEVSADGNFQF